MTTLLVLIGRTSWGGISTNPIGFTNPLITIGMAPLGGGPADPFGATKLLVSVGATPWGGESATVAGATNLLNSIGMTLLREAPRTPLERLISLFLSGRLRWMWEGGPCGPH